MKVDIKDLDKSQVLAALYNAARPQGMGFCQYDPTPMDTIEAKEILNTTTSFDYLHGRVMKLSLKENAFDSSLYNRDNGYNAAEQVIKSLKETNDPNNDYIKFLHEKGTQQAKVQYQSTINSLRAEKLTQDDLKNLGIQ